MTLTRPRPLTAAALLLILSLAFLPSVGRAQEFQDGPDVAELAATPPVAVVSLVWGEVTLKHPDGEYRPARWLDPVYPEDYVKTRGPGSKLLLTWFFDNHQEVLGPDTEAKVAYKTLSPLGGGQVRKDPPRNPFGTGVENPFVYTMKLHQEDFEHADDEGALAREASFLTSRVSAAYPPTFSWPALPGADRYQLQLFDARGELLTGASARGTRLKASPRLLSDATKGRTLQWQVTSGETLVVRRHPFMILSRPLQAWYSGIRQRFEGRRKRGVLERSDYTDLLLASAQLMQVDEVLRLCREMATLDERNPRVFRALVRAYLIRGCPAHAREARETELKLGGLDPILP